MKHLFILALIASSLGISAQPEAAPVAALEQELAELEQSLARIRASLGELREGGGTARTGDLDGDGDVDDVDIQILLTQWTGPREDNEPDPLPGPLQGPGTQPVASDDDLPEDVIKLGEDGKAVTLAIVQAALNGGRPVALPAGIELEGSLVLPHAREWLGVWGEGDRPVLKVPPGQNGITIASARTDEIVIREIEVRGPPLPHLGKNQGIRYRLNSRQGNYAKRVLIHDVKVVGFDSNIEIVDDWARTQGEGKPGRIELEINRSIVHLAYGSDSHSVGIYVEGLKNGLFKDTIIDHAGWRPGQPKDRNKRSHNIYAQKFNGPIVAEGCMFTRAAANAVQFRAGGSMVNCVISECSLGPWISRGGGRLENNVLLDQVDILPKGQANHETNPNADIRGHGFWPTAGGMVIRKNLAARQRGSQDKMRAFIEVAGNSEFEDNVAVDWAAGGLNFEFGGEVHRELGTNRTIDKDPGIPAFDEEQIQLRIDRPRGVWGPEYGTERFIKRCWAALN